MNPSPMMRDTRTPEQKRIAALEKLCRQQHEALKIANGLHPCPLYSDAVTAYTTLFPKTGGAK